MISIISGKIITNTGSEITVLTPGGVGYKIAINPARFDNWPVNTEAQILTYLSVRENAMDLFGFVSEAERQLFLKFLDVSGVGPKTALHLLSLGTVGEIVGAISRGDIAYLTNISGVGKKTAERMIVELKNKVSAIASVENVGNMAMGDNLGDVVEALVNLGYSAQQSRDAIKNLDAKDKTSEQLLKEALQKMR